MKFNKKLTEAIISSVASCVSRGETSGVIVGYEPLNFSIDKEPKNFLFPIPFSVLEDGKEGIIYIGSTS